MRVAIAQRRWEWITERVGQGVSHMKWWKKEAETERRLQDMWGVSPETEFVLLHSLRVEEQHWASPYNAMRGVGGKTLGNLTFMHGRAAREPLLSAPLVHRNWRLNHWEIKCAERLAIRRVLDGAARAHFLKLPKIQLCPCCRNAPDEQEHWLLQCPAMNGQRNAQWEKISTQFGEWVQKLEITAQHLLLSGRLPEKAANEMKYKGKFRVLESISQALERLQAAMVKFGVAMLELRKSVGGMGLRPGNPEA
eukprot:gene13958-biopygen15629